MLTLACKKKHLFKNTLLVAASYRKTHLFSSEYCEIYYSTYFEEDLRTAASENVFMKLRKMKICQEFFKKSISVFNINIRNK